MKLRNSHRVNLKAIIKHCQLEDKQVVYFKLGTSFYKWDGGKNIRKMSYLSAANFVRAMSLDTMVPVYEDEQVLLNGEPTKLIKKTFSVPADIVEQMGGK